MKNRSVPVSTLIPHVVYRSVPDACDWLTRVFGFREHFRYGQPVSGAQMRLGEAYIMLTEVRPGREAPAALGSATQWLTVIVEDVDIHYDRTVREGAKIWEELHETVYGERQYGAVDLDGHHWIFSQHARDLSPEDWGAALASN